MLEKELERVKSELIHMGVEKIILFGSMVKGELGLMSDVDIVTIMETDMNFIERLRYVYSRIRPKSVDILVYTPEEFKNSKNGVFLKNVLKEGVVIYEKER